MNLDSLLWLIGVVAEAAVVVLLLYRRVWRTLPVFCIFCVWTLFSDLGAYAVYHFFRPSYSKAYLAEVIVGSALEFTVLVEVAWSVLRPMRTSLPRSILVVVGALIVAAGAAIWPFSGIHELAGLSPVMRNLIRLEQTTSILRILFFLALAGSSQLFSIGWRDRELQVATGLGFYSMVSLVATILHTHQAMGPAYLHLEQVVVAGSICSLLYWVFSFAQKEAERRAFTPQMQHLLLAVAGAARTTRVALTDSEPPKTRKR
jgi:hypothetical protein